MRLVRLVGALALVLSLLSCVDSLVFAPDGWGPEFHRLWGGITVALGFAFVVFGRGRDTLSEREGSDGREAPVFAEFEFFGVAFAVSGAAYGSTGEVWVFVTCVLMSSVVFEFGFRERSDVPLGSSPNDSRGSRPDVQARDSSDRRGSAR